MKPVDIIRQAINMRKNYITPIPNDAVIDKKHLGPLSNDEFVSAFSEMQNIIISIYEDAEKNPFGWGYSEDCGSDNPDLGVFSRVADILYAIFSSGTYEHDIFVVKRKDYKKATKGHKNIDLFIKSLSNFGFVFENYESKTETFTASYPDNDKIIYVLHQFALARDREYTLSWAQHAIFESFSYRWVEDKSKQNHETIFLAKVDMYPQEMQKIQYWLYDEAAKRGYKILKKKPFDKGCIYYQKGSKGFLIAGIRNDICYSKAIFRKVFETNPDDIKEIWNRLPKAFGKDSASFDNSSLCRHCSPGKEPDGRCDMRIKYEIDGDKFENCAYQSFYFYNPTLDDMKLILKLFMIENKIE